MSILQRESFAEKKRDDREIPLFQYVGQAARVVWLVCFDGLGKRLSMCLQRVECSFFLWCLEFESETVAGVVVVREIGQRGCVCFAYPLLAFVALLL